MNKANKLEPDERLYEYRILYNPGSETSAENSYHYYNALNAPQALDFHFRMLEKRNIVVQTLKIEKNNPFSNKWEDESSILESISN